MNEQYKSKRFPGDEARTSNRSLWPLRSSVKKLKQTVRGDAALPIPRRSRMLCTREERRLWRCKRPSPPSAYSFTASQS
jgi:hypothetical protein